MKENHWLRDHWLILLTGVVVGAAALILTAAGNPKNMGFCIACFERDIAGALGLHSAAKVQYIRPEIIGIVLGSLLAAVAAKEFRGRAGSSPACRFVLGLFVMIGALVFLGCPLRMVIRLGGGDLTAVAGLLGFVGLIVPHIVRLLVGSDYRYIIPGSAIFGVATVTLSDTAARLILAPAELPVGIIMAFIGAPFFLFLLRKEV